MLNLKTPIASLIIASGLLGIPNVASAADSTQPVTFSKDVAPIFQAKCQSCHEPGSIAPMSLVTFADTRPWARSIKARVAARQMPPWHIDRSVGVQKFKNDMSLSDEQVDTIVRWVDQGALEGTRPPCRSQNRSTPFCTGKPKPTDLARQTSSSRRPCRRCRLSTRMPGGVRFRTSRSRSHAG